ncbi:MAG: hypothetical protein H0X16_10670 [Chloroflexi bacterium]|nr:hypothetical protein [Chloroflexota bacterium]
MSFWEVKDRAGQTIAIHQRKDRPDGGKDMAWRRPSGELGLNGTRLESLPLYGAHRLAAEWPEPQPLVLTEGEKACDALVAAGVPAVASVTGASSTPSAESLGDLAGRFVILWPDNDEAGRAHMLRIAERLSGSAVVGWLDWSDAPEKGDAADFLAHHEAADVRELLKSATDVPDDISGTTPSAESAVSAVSTLSAHTAHHLSAHTALSAQRQWPEPPGRQAFLGLAGRVVEAVDGYTEADPVAVLATFLAAFGSLVGSGPHALVGADRHGANLFLALVGKSAKARKGASWTPVRELFRQVDLDWTAQRVIGGLGSGEGVVHCVRDRVERLEGKKDGDFEVVVVDPGEDDKRALVLAPELAAVLRVMARQGSTLSAVLRDAWDRGDLRITTRNAPIRATGAHVSVIAHVTEEELRRELTDTETVNGFGNRFLWLAVRRSKELPEPEPFRGAELDRLAAEVLEAALATANLRAELTRTDAARELWRAEYPQLSAERSGLAGALTDRGEPQVLRLSLVYALADRSPAIDVPHLEAALELWRYAERSTTYLFGDSLGDPVADRILGFLRVQGPQAREALRELFGRHVASGRLDHALLALAERGLVEVRREATGGRPRELWRIPEQSAKSALS